MRVLRSGFVDVVNVRLSVLFHGRPGGLLVVGVFAAHKPLPGFGIFEVLDILGVSNVPGVLGVLDVL
eukprot:100987-Amorphochlora_amoeboformis.AAC.1